MNVFGARAKLANTLWILAVISLAIGILLSYRYKLSLLASSGALAAVVWVVLGASANDDAKETAEQLDRLEARVDVLYTKLSERKESVQ